MAFPIGLIFSAGSYLLRALEPMIKSAGASDEVVSGARLLVSLGPRAIQLVEDINNGVAPSVIQERWEAAKAAVEAGNKAWEDADEA